MGPGQLIRPVAEDDGVLCRLKDDLILWSRRKNQVSAKETRAMIAYVTVGADDMDRAKRFYASLLPPLGYGVTEGPDGLSYALPVEPGQSAVLPDFYVKPTFDGKPASAGNGAMVAFEARSQKQVRDLHAAALAAGGFDEGQPGFRDSYGADFYVGYLRDPQGNKIALFSSDPNEPGRDG
ncbi:MAG: VOC family protein [Rhizobiaceae bacterium]